MHRLAARTWFQIGGRNAHRRAQRRAIFDDGQATVVADIGPLMRVSGPRIGLIESSGQMLVLGRDPSPQAKRAIHMHPGAVFPCRFANFPCGIERSRIHVPCLNAHNCLLRQARQLIGSHSSLAFCFHGGYAFPAKSRKAQRLQD